MMAAASAQQLRSASTEFAPDAVVLAYHGSLLYRAVVTDVTREHGVVTGYLLQYQGWMKSWNSHVPASAVFEYNQANLRIAHRLLHHAKLASSHHSHSSHTPSNASTTPDSFQRRNLLRVTLPHAELPHQPSLSDDDTPDTDTPPGPWQPGVLEPPRTVEHDGMLHRERALELHHVSRKRKHPNGNAASASSPDSTRGEDALHVLENESSCSSPLFHLPSTLKQQLVDDWEFVTKEQHLVPLPRTPSVSAIVDAWVHQHEQHDADSACREVGHGIKTYFDTALPTMLLYKFERRQFNEYFVRHDTPSKHYGAEHLTRLLLKLPFMLDAGELDNIMMRRIAEKVNLLARFVADNGRTFFLTEYEPAPPAYVELLSRGDVGSTPVPLSVDASPHTPTHPSPSSDEPPGSSASTPASTAHAAP